MPYLEMHLLITIILFVGKPMYQRDKDHWAGQFEWKEIARGTEWLNNPHTMFSWP